MEAGSIEIPASSAARCGETAGVSRIASSPSGGRSSPRAATSLAAFGLVMPTACRSGPATVSR